jgi:hypothetical protein
MIRLSEYARLLCEKLTPAQANSIFAKYGVNNALSLDKINVQKTIGLLLIE